MGLPDDDDDDAVPVDTQEARLLARIALWQSMLYHTSAVTLLMGLVIVAVAIWAIASKSFQLFSPEWVLLLLALFGALVSLVSVVGLCGARRSQSKILAQQHNAPLLLYVVSCVLIVLVVTVVAIEYLQLMTDLQTSANVAAANGGAGATPLEVRMMKGLSDQVPPALWVATQTTLGCCGYLTADFDGSLSTGPACTTGTPAPCRVPLLAAALQRATAVGLAAALGLIAQLVGLVAGGFLCCCVGGTPLNNMALDTGLDIDDVDGGGVQDQALLGVDVNAELNSPMDDVK